MEKTSVGHLLCISNCARIQEFKEKQGKVPFFRCCTEVCREVLVENLYLVEKFSIRTDTTYHPSGEAMAREELIGSQAAGNEGR